MRSKKIQSKHMRKHRNKKSNKSKKCGCGVKLPFLKWGGDNPNGPTNDSGITGQFNDLLTNIKKASNETTAKLGEGFNDLTNSTKSVFNDTKNQITETTKGIVDNAQKNTSEFTNKAKGLVTNVYDTTKTQLDKVGSFPSTPKKDISTTSSLSSSSKNGSNKTTSSISSSSSSSNKSNSTNYTKAIEKHRSLLMNSNGNSANNNKQQGGKRMSSKRQGSRKNVKSKKTKRRRHIYKHKGGSGYIDGPVGIEKSSLAFTASPISNINAVGPRPDQMYGQTPYPAWRFSN